MPSPILPLSGEGSGILFGSTLIRFQTTFASRSEPRFSSTKIVKAGRKRELVPGFPRRIRSSSKIAKDRGNRAGFDAKIAEPPPILSKDNGRRAMNRTLFGFSTFSLGRVGWGPLRSFDLRWFELVRTVPSFLRRLPISVRQVDRSGTVGFRGWRCRSAVRRSLCPTFGRDRRNFGNRA